MDINQLRRNIAKKYRNACQKIGHLENVALIRSFETHVPKSNFLNVIFRGNQPLNFTSRITDKDLILLFSDAIKQTQQFVRHIDLSYNQISDIGIQVLSKFIRQCPNLQSLNLQGNNIGPSGGQILGQFLKNTDNLKYLNLDYNKIGTEGTVALTQHLLFSNKLQGGKKSLQQLNLGNNEINHDGMIVITSTLHWTNNTLKILNVDNPVYHSIGQQTAIHFAKMLQSNRAIQKLSLKKHAFTCEAIFTMTQHMLQNNKLKVLDLTANLISFNGCKALSKYLQGKYCALQSLILTSNRTGHYGAKHIAQALSKNRSLIHLDMTKNDIDDNGLKMIAESLQTNETLISLKLYWNHFGQLSLKQFHKLSKRQSEWYWDFTTYIVDEQISMAHIQNHINYDISVSNKYFMQ